MTYLRALVTGEAIAHLKYPEEQGLIQREMDEDVRSFVFRYS